MNTSRLRNKLAKFASRHGWGKGKRYALPEAIVKGLPMEQLHLGCGNVHIDGWCNVDVLESGATDLVLDITSLPGIAPDSVSRIYSCHVLEHFETSAVPSILSHWRRVLKPGGELRISVPDLDAITRIYQKNLQHFQVPGHQPWIALIYGGQKDRYDFHKTGFNLNWLSHLLREAGFARVEPYPHRPHFIEGVTDNSLADVPFGEFISLNVVAYK